MTQPRTAAIGALAMALPIGLLLAAVTLPLGPLESVMRQLLADPSGRPTPIGHVYMVGGLVLLIPALVLAVVPILRRDPEGARRPGLINVLAVVVTAGLIVLTWGALAEEVVRCDVLGIPDCD